MINYTMNEEITKRMAEGRVGVVDQYIDKDIKTMMLTIQDAETKEVARLRIESPATDNGTFDINTGTKNVFSDSESNTRVSVVSINGFRKFYQTEYFDCKAVVLQDKDNPDNRAVIYSEVL